LSLISEDGIMLIPLLRFETDAGQKKNSPTKPLFYYDSKVTAGEFIEIITIL
jgi:hypothetical protein